MPVQPLGWEDPLEKEVAAHSSIPAGKSHGQRSLAGYSPWGCKGVRHYLATKQQHPGIWILYKNHRSYKLVSYFEIL